MVFTLEGIVLHKGGMCHIPTTVRVAHRTELLLSVGGGLPTGVLLLVRGSPKGGMCHILTSVRVAHRTWQLLPIGGGLLMGVLFGLLLVGSTPIGALLVELLLVEGLLVELLLLGGGLLVLGGCLSGELQLRWDLISEL